MQDVYNNHVFVRLFHSNGGGITAWLRRSPLPIHFLLVRLCPRQLLGLVALFPCRHIDLRPPLSLLPHFFIGGSSCCHPPCFIHLNPLLNSRLLHPPSLCCHPLPLLDPDPQSFAQVISSTLACSSLFFASRSFTATIFLSDAQCQLATAAAGGSAPSPWGGWQEEEGEGQQHGSGVASAPGAWPGRIA